MTTTHEKDTKYNGWTNYETWAVKLWIDNEQSSYRSWQSIAQDIWDDSIADRSYKGQTREQAFTYDLAKRLKDEHEENAPTSEANVYSDLMNAALSEVNWYEIAEHYLEDIDRTEDEEESEDDE